MRRLRLVHISDTHFGADIDGGNTHAHDYRVVEAFYNALSNDLRFDDDDYVMLVVTGDLSARGHQDELRFYETLRDVGLTRRDPLVRDLERWFDHFDQVFDVLGNHDYWNGLLLNPFLNRSLRLHPDWQFPRRTAVDCGAFRVFMHGVCSTSGASQREQIMAVGSMTTRDALALHAQLLRSEREAIAEGRSPLHILVHHHSTLHGSDRYHGISRTSEQVLTDVHASYPIRALLTGHAHTLDARRRKPELPFEVRAPSTMTRAKFWSKKIPGFVVHTLEPRASDMHWSWVGWHYQGTRFRPQPRAASVP